MAIVPAPQKKTTRPPVNEQDAAAFINAAPDGKGAAPTSRKRKVPISFSLPLQLLDALDAHAAATGQSRAFVLNVALTEYLAGRGQAGD